MNTDWIKHLNVRYIDPDCPWNRNNGCALAQGHYLNGMSFGRFSEFTFPFKKILEIICDQFNLPVPDLQFSNRGYRVDGRAFLSYRTLPGGLNRIKKIILYHKSGRTIRVLIHEIAHFWGWDHDHDFMAAETRLIRWVEDNLIPPPGGHIGWRDKLAKLYVTIHGDWIDGIESFIDRHNLDLSSDTFLDMVINYLPA